MKKKVFTTRNMAITAMLAAIAGVLMFLEIPLPIFPVFYQLDFSDVPTIVGTFMFGPASGIAIEMIKILIKLILKGTSTNYVGEIVSIPAALIFVLSLSISFALLKKVNKSVLRAAILSLGICLVIRVAWACFQNAYISLPLFCRVYGWDMDKLISMFGSPVNDNINNLQTFIIFATLPFNLLKYALNYLIGYFLSSRLRRWVFGMEASSKCAITQN